MLNLTGYHAKKMNINSCQALDINYSKASILERGQLWVRVRVRGTCDSYQYPLAAKIEALKQKKLRIYKVGFSDFFR